MLNSHHNNSINIIHQIESQIFSVKKHKIYSLSYLINIQYNIIKYSYHVVHYISMTHLFYNCKFVPFDHHKISFIKHGECYKYC